MLYGTTVRSTTNLHSKRFTSGHPANEYANKNMADSDPLRINELEDNEDYAYVNIPRFPPSKGNRRITREEKKARMWANKGVDRKLFYHHVPVPPAVQVTAAGSQLFFSGPLGSNAIDLEKTDKKGMAAFKLVRGEGDQIEEIQIAGPCKDTTRSAHTLVQNRVNGVVRGYLMYLQLVGVGYRVSKMSKDVTYTVHSG
jgi:hypothetical protein